MISTIPFGWVAIIGVSILIFQYAFKLTRTPAGVKGLPGPKGISTGMTVLLVIANTNFQADSLSAVRLAKVIFGSNSRNGESNMVRSISTNRLARSMSSYQPRRLRMI